MDTISHIQVEFYTETQVFVTLTLKDGKTMQTYFSKNEYENLKINNEIKLKFIEKSDKKEVR